MNKCTTNLIGQKYTANQESVFFCGIIVATEGVKVKYQLKMQSMTATLSFNFLNKITISTKLEPMENLLEEWWQYKFVMIISWIGCLLIELSVKYQILFILSLSLNIFSNQLLIGIRIVLTLISKSTLTNLSPLILMMKSSLIMVH